MMRPNPLTPARLIVLLCAIGLSSSLASSSVAQLPPLRPSPSPTATPAPTPNPTSTPSPAPSASPSPGPGLPSDPLPTDPTPSPSPAPSGSPSPTPVLGLEGDGGDGLGGEIPEGFEVPILDRTPARNTIELVAILSELKSVGIPLEEALAEGMGRVPVGGLTYWSDDWWNPRFTPVFHLHEGLDMFADFGTPVRAPDAGVVTRMTDSPVGGIAVWMRARDGTQYYFAHLQDWAAGIEVGRPVKIGTVLGYVGDSGNARGGAPHLHLEVHQPDEIPPKPIVDAWLDEALEAAPRFVARKKSEILAERKLLRAEQSLAGVLGAERSSPQATPEYSMLLALLDPVAGSVGMLPGVSLVPPPREVAEERLLGEFVRLRVNGGIVDLLGGIDVSSTDE